MPHCIPFSLLLKDQFLLPFPCGGWKDGSGVNWRLYAFNPLRQDPPSTDADEGSIFPCSHSPWRAQQKLCRVGLWAAVLLPSKLIRFCSTKVYAQGIRTEAVSWWFSMPFTSQPPCREYCCLHLTKQLHHSHARWDWWHRPNSFDCFLLHWPWSQRFSQSCLTLLFQDYISSKIVAEIQHVFCCPYVHFFGQ